MQTPGAYISAAGHIGLIVWLLVGWGFDAEPLDFQTMDVSVLSSEEFKAMTRTAQTPEPGEAEPDEPVPPVVDPNPAPPPPAEPAPQPAPPPAPVEPPEDETPPPPPPPPPASPQVPDTTPPTELTMPRPPAATPNIQSSSPPTPPRADTVTNTVTPPPPQDARPDDIDRTEVTSQPTIDTLPVVEEPPTAPPATTTEIVPEDMTPSGAVETSIRPSSRPNRPAPPAPEPEVEREQEQPQVAETSAAQTVPNQAIDDVLEGLDLEAPTQTPAAPAPAVAAGPPMTGSEKENFRIAVNRCWNVDPGSVAARVTVEVGFSLDRAGSVIGNEVRLIRSDGDQSATNTAFEAARRAILRCQSGGYQLPADKYDQWKDVVITFDPSGMRMR